MLMAQWPNGPMAQWPNGTSNFTTWNSLVAGFCRTRRTAPAFDLPLKLATCPRWKLENHENKVESKFQRWFQNSIRIRFRTARTVSILEHVLHLK